MLQCSLHFIGVIMPVLNEHFREKLRVVLGFVGFIALFVSVIIGGVTVYVKWKSPNWIAARQIVREVRAQHPGLTQYIQQFDACMASGEYRTAESILVCQHRGRMAAGSEAQLGSILTYDNDVFKRLLSAKLDYPPSDIMEAQ
jgi:hypothetical protein